MPLLLVVGLGWCGDANGGGMSEWSPPDNREAATGEEAIVDHALPPTRGLELGPDGRPRTSLAITLWSTQEQF